MSGTPALLAALLVAIPAAETGAAEVPLDAAPARCSELSQLLSGGEARPEGAFRIFALESRYPIWGARLRDDAAVLETLGSAMLWIDLTGAIGTPLSPADDLDGDGRIDRVDIGLGVSSATKKGTSFPGGEYEVARLMAVAARWESQVPGKTVEMPPMTRALLERLAELRVAEKTAEGWRALKPASIIFFSGSCDEGCLMHELNHALYFSEPAYRARVARIWKELPSASREALRNALLSVYALADEDLLLTEFAAYGADGFPSHPFRFEDSLAAPMRKLSGRLRRVRDEFLPPRKPAVPGKPADGSRIWVTP